MRNAETSIEIEPTSKIPVSLISYAVASWVILVYKIAVNFDSKEETTHRHSILYAMGMDGLATIFTCYTVLHFLKVPMLKRTHLLLVTTGCVLYLSCSIMVFAQFHWHAHDIDVLVLGFCSVIFSFVLLIEIISWSPS